MGKIPSGCAILTAQSRDHSTGVLVSWFQQVNFDLPMISVCLKSGRPAGQLVDESRRFLLNLIGDEPAAMFKHFGRGFALGEDAFAGLAISATAYGPALPACIAALACEVKECVVCGDHLLYVAHVVSGSMVENSKPYVHLRKSGMTY